MNNEYKYCPVCGKRYRAEVGDCPDCHAALVAEEELQRPPGPAAKEDIAAQEYKYCPRCGAEYEKDVEECGDCFIPLVSFEESQRLMKEKEEPAEVVVHIASSAEDATEIVELLKVEGVESARAEAIDTKKKGMTFRPGWLFHVVVPVEDREHAQFILQFNLEDEWQARGRAGDMVRESLERLEDAIEAGRDGLPALVEFFGDFPQLRIEAVKAALEHGEAGRETVAEWIRKRCRESELRAGELGAVGDACFLLGAQYPEWAVSELEPGLASAEAWVRKNFCFALGKLGTELAIPCLVDSLRDPDFNVRNEAIDQLYNFEHTDYGYDPDREPEEQRKALEKWQGLAADIK